MESMKTGKEIDKMFLRGLRAPKPNEHDKTLVVKVQDWAHADIRECIERINELTGELQAKEETLRMLFEIINKTYKQVLRIWKGKK